MRKILINTCIVLGITLVLFISSEIALRIIFPDKRPVRENSVPKDVAYQFNEDYLVSLKPNMEKTHYLTTENGVKSVLWRTNKNSFRGEELDENPDIRIIVYGDSNIQARFLNLQDTFPYRLEKYLRNRLKKNIEVLNAGVIGFGPDQSLIRFSKEVDRYHPDIVIFHIFADNDFGDIIRNRLFELDSAGNLIETSFKKEPDELLMETLSLKHSFHNFVSSLLIVRGAKKVLKRILPGKHQNEHDKDLIHLYMSLIEAEYAVHKHGKSKQFSHFADHYDLDVAVSPDAESSVMKKKLMAAILIKAKNLAAAKGVKFLVLIQPSVIDLTENFAISYKDLIKYPGYKRTNLTDAIDSICTMNNIHKINLLNVFSGNNPEDLFLKGDNHWNERGQDVAARETAAYLLSNMMLKNNLRSSTVGQP